MELNELKKQWNALDNRLQQTPITRTDEVEKLIARCRHDADSGVKKLRTMQVVSLGIGVAVVLLVVLGTIWACIAGIEQTMIQKYAELLIFMAITLHWRICVGLEDLPPHPHPARRHHARGGGEPAHGKARPMDTL